MNPYEIIKKLGSGSYGEVFLCRKKHNLQEIVMKQIKADKIKRSDDLVKNEIRILKSLNHPNIITYFDSYLNKDVYYIIMEYAPGGTLYQTIQESRGYFTKNFVMSIFTQILLALNHVHSKNIIHRDLKPENIFLSGTQRNCVKVGDFGISKLLRCSSDETITGIGTINYLAPEICNGQSYDIKSDIWSLGCVIFEICSLQRMFDGPLSHIVHKINNGIIKPIDVNLYGNTLQCIINMTLQIDSKLRPTTNDIINIPPINSYVVASKLNIGIN